MIPTLALVHVRYKVAAGDLLAARALLAKYSEDQPRDERGRWEGSSTGEGGKLGAAVDRWVANSAGIRAAMAGEKASDWSSEYRTSTARATRAQERADGHLIVDALAKKGRAAPTLYRGLSPWEGEHSLDALTNLKVGDELDLNISSWSTDNALANKWAINAGDGGMVLKCEEGAQALDLAGHSSMAEWVTDGHFQVTGIERGVKLGMGQLYQGGRRFALKGTIISVRQTAVFDAPRLRGTA
jgi:hypothetical protein